MQSLEQSSLARQQTLACKADLDAVQGGSSCNVAVVPACYDSKPKAMQCDAEEAWAPAPETAAELQRHFTGHAGRMEVAEAAAAIGQLGLAEDVTPQHIIKWWKSAGCAQQQQQSSAAADTAEDKQPRARRRKQRPVGCAQARCGVAAGSSCNRAWYERLPEAREAFRQAAEECGCGTDTGCSAQQVIDYMKRGGENGSNKAWPGLVEVAKLSASNCSDLLLGIRQWLLSSRPDPIELKSRPEDRFGIIKFSTGGYATG